METKVKTTVEVRVSQEELIKALNLSEVKLHSTMTAIVDVLDVMSPMPVLVLKFSFDE